LLPEQTLEGKIDGKIYPKVCSKVQTRRLKAIDEKHKKKTLIEAVKAN
jgi:hypothetical protein